MAKQKSKQQRKKPQATKQPTKGTNTFFTLPVIIIFILSFVLYANTLGHQFALDDYAVIVDNAVTKQGVSGIPTIFTTNYRHGMGSYEALYRPLSMAQFAAEWSVSPNNPSVHHFFNILYYALTGILLFLTLKLVWKKYTILLPLLATLFFIAHPVHTEVVANIKSRDEMMTFFFCIGALYFLWKYWDSKKTGLLVASLASYTLAMFSKENAITFLAVIPLMIFCFTPKENWRNKFMTSLLFLIPVVIYMLVRTMVLGDVVATGSEAAIVDNMLTGVDNFGTRTAAAFVLLGKYLLSLVVPVFLVSDYGFNSVALSGWADWRPILSLLIFAGAIGWAVFNIRKNALPAFGVLYGVITFSIFTNIIFLIGSSYGERFLYMASLGFAILLAWGLLKLLGNLNIEKNGSWKNLLQNKTLLAAVAGILVLYSFKTIHRNQAWKDSYTLYKTDINNAPNCAKLNYNLGVEQGELALKQTAQQKRVELTQNSIKSFEQAVAIHPGYAEAYRELGLAYKNTGQTNKALQQYEESLKYQPDDARVYSYLCDLHFGRKELEKARIAGEKCISINPKYVEGHRNLGSVYVQMGRLDDGMAQYKKGLEVDPNNAILHQYIGFVYMQKGDKVNGQQWLNKAQVLDPSLKVQ